MSLRTGGGGGSHTDALSRLYNKKQKPWLLLLFCVVLPLIPQPDGRSPFIKRKPRGSNPVFTEDIYFDFS